MDMPAIIGTLIPFGFFAMIAAIVIVPRYFRSQERQKMAELMKAAIEHGQQVSPEVMDALSTSAGKAVITPAPARDLRTGLVWLGVAVGLACMGWAISFEEPDALFPMVGISAFPAFIGAAFIVMWAIARDKK
jgi:hypothetical protein